MIFFLLTLNFFEFFFFFVVLYSCICFIILPALSAILKTRKIKLAQTKISADILESKSLFIKNINAETNNLFSNNQNFLEPTQKMEWQTPLQAAILTISFENFQKRLVSTKQSIISCVVCNKA